MYSRAWQAADRRQSAEFSLPPHCSLLTHGQGQPEAPVRQHEVPGQDGEVAAVTVCPGVSHTITPSDTSVPLVRWGTVNHHSVSHISIGVREMAEVLLYLVSKLFV